MAEVDNRSLSYFSAGVRLIQLTAKDYFANRDTVMETLLTILGRQAGK
jgi:hypothetical protein